MSDKNIYNTEFTTEKTLKTVLGKLSTSNVENQSKKLIERSKEEAKEKFRYSKKKKSSGFGVILKRNKESGKAQKTRSRIYRALYRRAILDTLLGKVGTKREAMSAELEKIKAERKTKQGERKEKKAEEENKKKISELCGKQFEAAIKKCNLDSLFENIEKKIEAIDCRLASKDVEGVLQDILEEGFEKTETLKVVKKSCEKMKEDKVSRELKEKEEKERKEKESEKKAISEIRNDLKVDFNLERFENESDSGSDFGDEDEVILSNLPGWKTSSEKKRKKKIRL